MTSMAHKNGRLKLPSQVGVAVSQPTSQPASFDIFKDTTRAMTTIKQENKTTKIVIINIKRNHVLWPHINTYLHLDNKL